MSPKTSKEKFIQSSKKQFNSLLGNDKTTDTNIDFGINILELLFAYITFFVPFIMYFESRPDWIGPITVLVPAISIIFLLILKKFQTFKNSDKIPYGENPSKHFAGLYDIHNDAEYQMEPYHYPGSSVKILSFLLAQNQKT